jgi:hypothetical protein
LDGADGVGALSSRIERPAEAEGQPLAVPEMSVAEIDALADAVEAEFDITAEADARLFKAMCTVSIEEDCGAAFTAILPNFKLREQLLPFEYTNCVAKANLKQRAEEGVKGEALRDRTAFIERFLGAITSVEAEGT